MKSGSGIVVTLYDCLLSYFKTQELIDKDNLFFCEACDKKSESTMTYKILEFPNVLILIVKRFKFTKSGSKISVHVQLPLSINMNKFASNPDLNFEYCLIGIIQHSGNLSRGHYQAYCKNQKNNKWYNYNDRRVSECADEEILNSQAYIAFYQRLYKPRPKVIEVNPEVYVPIE